MLIFFPVCLNAILTVSSESNRQDFSNCELHKSSVQKVSFRTTRKTQHHYCSNVIAIKRGYDREMFPLMVKLMVIDIAY